MTAVLLSFLLSWTHRGVPGQLARRGAQSTKGRRRLVDPRRSNGVSTPSALGHDTLCQAQLVVVKGSVGLSVCRCVLAILCIDTQTHQGRGDMGYFWPHWLLAGCWPMRCQSVSHTTDDCVSAVLRGKSRVQPEPTRGSAGARSTWAGGTSKV